MASTAPSLRSRLLLTLAALLLVAAAAAAIALDSLYRNLGQRAQENVLDAQVIALISTAEIDAEGRLVPQNLAEPRLATPGSGLYAEILGARGSWRSPSAVGSGLNLAADPLPGERRVERAQLADGTPVLGLSLGVRWEQEDGQVRDFVIRAAQSLVPWQRELLRVRAGLATGFLVLAFLLLGGLAVALGVALEPLRRLEREIVDIEAGRRESLGGGWPRELSGVTGNLNALLVGERNRLERYRTTLGNLAHSLKTPLAALRGLVDCGESAPAALVPQLDRMQAIVQHQLKRAVFGGSGATLMDQRVAEPLEQLRAALAKVYADKRIAISVAVAPGTAYPVDAGDLLELAGNLMDNGCKYGRNTVAVRAMPWTAAAWRRPGLVLEVEDDGAGIPPAERDRILERGARADESVGGQGIGLAVAREIASVYGGTLEIGASRHGGALVRARLPGR
ncbi:MAG: two-component sensor histidine kinase [Gammaproteobacteria bacterium]|nr:two-component sensor histidine kinase [Gammaproteobacteria bacterium]